jgi:hypothetical protein
MPSPLAGFSLSFPRQRKSVPPSGNPFTCYSFPLPAILATRPKAAGQPKAGFAKQNSAQPNKAGIQVFNGLSAYPKIIV